MADGDFEFDPSDQVYDPAVLAGADAGGAAGQATGLGAGDPFSLGTVGAAEGIGDSVAQDPGIGTAPDTSWSSLLNTTLGGVNEAIKAGVQQGVQQGLGRPAATPPAAPPVVRLPNTSLMAPQPGALSTMSPTTRTVLITGGVVAGIATVIGITWWATRKPRRGRG